MSAFFSFYKKCLPLTVGLVFSLLALCCLVRAMTEDYDPSGPGILFMFFAMIGFPALFYGVKSLSE